MATYRYSGLEYNHFLNVNVVPGKCRGTVEKAHVRMLEHCTASAMLPDSHCDA